MAVRILVQENLIGSGRARCKADIYGRSRLTLPLRHGIRTGTCRRFDDDPVWQTDDHAAVCTECTLFDAELIRTVRFDHPHLSIPDFADVCFADLDDLVAGEVIDALFPAANGNLYAVFWRGSKVPDGKQCATEEK